MSLYGSDEPSGKQPRIIEMLQASLDRGDWAFLVAEGDDDALQIVGTVGTFGKGWRSAYAEFGFRVEPQGAHLVSASSRMPSRTREAEPNCVLKIL